jgi:hypothetical protein
VEFSIAPAKPVFTPFDESAVGSAEEAAEMLRRLPSGWPMAEQPVARTARIPSKPISSGSGAYVIRNVATGRVIDDPAFNPGYVGIITRSANGGSNQGWNFQ